MNMDSFLKRFPEVLMNEPHDAIFEAMILWVGGSTSHRIGKLLNFAVSQMDLGECYVEIGVFNGGTLISANWRNGRSCIGIDPFEGMVEVHNPTPIRDRARRNVEMMGEGARLIEKDFRNVTKEEIGLPIAVCFIDAMHNFKDVTDNLVWLEPLLANDALIFFDDVNYGGVQEAIHEWHKNHAETYDMTIYLKPFYQDAKYVWSMGDRFLNNGLCVLRYHRNAASVAQVFSS
jgi:predicted O-methyltransferase YrrM